MTHDVFISHSSKDKIVADATCAWLERKGIRCWVAPRDIMPGANWGASIIKAIRGARVMILIFSSHANSSPQIKREVERAVHFGVTVIPMRIEDVVPGEDLEYFLGMPHWLDAFGAPVEQYFDSLAAAVREILALPAPPKDPEIQADVHDPALEDHVPDPVPETVAAVSPILPPSSVPQPSTILPPTPTANPAVILPPTPTPVAAVTAPIKPSTLPPAPAPKKSGSGTLVKVLIGVVVAVVGLGIVGVLGVIFLIGLGASASRTSATASAPPTTQAAEVTTSSEQITGQILTEEEAAKITPPPAKPNAQTGSIDGTDVKAKDITSSKDASDQ